ncbi:hypothetical protein [Gordonia jinhuaensis]|nr:hypothetical protein [Gordonia jinhuaensis]
MRLRKIAIGTVAAGSVAAAGLGVGAGLASAAPAPHSGGGTQQVH